ncbi:mitochondrial thiamine pyrophosphate carrier-like [Galleria mellonella]|uniref:Mitochondrial thiamine pyrophosphate carrier-like n=1 Tax=Galleria mellonella TaxID=7137 RepID=A0A6J1X1D0_GALME|nr:mitochondrial thiamine pyrophosphate carrier-like [Galleria mellonella]
MVGYQKDDIMTPNQKLIAGCVSGMATRFMTQPMDIVKLRTQLQNLQALDKKKIWFRTTRKILREEGITAFWAGHNLGQIHSILAVTSQFYIYEVSTKYVAGLSQDKGKRPYLFFLCGVFSGCCCATLVLPIEVIRVRQMIVKEQYRGLFNGAKAVYNHGGILAFYEGLSASLLQMGPSVGISFGVFQSLQPRILSYFHDCSSGQCVHASSNTNKPEHLLVASTIAGSVAGFVAKSVTYPFDLAKRRLQIATHKEDFRYQTPSTSRNLVKCTNLADCIIKTLKKEGIRGLYRGWKVTVCKAQVTSVMSFTTYELMCYAIRELES